MFRSPHKFYLADDFLPQRWLGTDSRFAGDRKDAFQPFSYGPRNCIGRYLAYTEMRSILARIVFSFDFELRPESYDWVDQKSYNIWDKGPLYVNLTHLAKYLSVSHSFPFLSLSLIVSSAPHDPV